MVDKKIIIKSINDAIIKCSSSIRVGKNSLSNKVKSTLNKFAKRTESNTIEQGLIIGSNGEELDLNEGTYENVSYTEDEVLKALTDNNGKDLYFTHNHVGSFIDKEGKYDEVLQLNMPTMLSLADIQTLFETGEYNGVKITPFKSITADSTNGTRMTLTRIDNDGEDLTNNHVLNNLSDSKFYTNEAWKNMYSRWATFFNQYNNGVKNFSKTWLEENRPKYMKLYEENGHDESVFHGENGMWSELSKAQEKYNKDYIKNNYEDMVMKDSIKEFEEIGFELSMEWR